MSAMSDLASAGKLAPAQVEFRVLVVDDDPDMAAFLARLLGAEGMIADTVLDGETALERVAAASPDLILLDVMLPGADGFTICEKLKGDPATAMIPIVLVTALDGRQDRIKGLELGADEYISKPFHLSSLVRKIEYMLGKKST